MVFNSPYSDGKVTLTDKMSVEKDLETDTVKLAQEMPPYPRLNDEELHNQLIEINEEFCSEEIEVLKFLCYDILPASKLENADSALSIFENLKKGNRLTYTNVDFLLECLWWMHRKDLIRKLGFDPKEVEPHIPGLSNILPYRKLLLELREDITDKEFNTIKFYLDGKVKKKKLQDKKNLMELFIFLEQEGLISHCNPELLLKLMQAIKRADLIDRVKEHFGRAAAENQSRIPPTARVNQGEGQVPSQTSNTEQAVFSSNADRQRQIIAGAPAPAVARTVSVGGGQGRNEQPLPNQGGRRPPVHIDRSPSAGTMSAPSSMEEGAVGEERGIVPDPLLRKISQDVKDVSDDFGMELGFSNTVIVQYQRKFPDPANRCYHMMKLWQYQKEDQGQVVPGLRYALDKLGYKQTSKVITDWFSGFTAAQQPPPQHQGNQPVGPPAGEPVFQPAGPPGPQNIYTDINEAQFVQEEPMQLQLSEENRQQTGTVSDPMALLLPGTVNMENLRGQLQQLSMNVEAQNTGNQIPPLNQHPMHVPVIGAPELMDQGQGQVAEAPLNQMEEDLMSMELPTYKMDASPKGICVIINNRNFIVNPSDPSSKEMPERRGTDVDATQLQQLFTKLDFVVEMKVNLTDTDMMQLLVDIAHNTDHRNYDCFVCCILTHGVLNHLYGTNGRLVNIKDLTSVFQANRCPSLAGKPKLFFLQACQGRDKMGGGEIERDASPYGNVPRSLSNNVETDNDQQEMIPNESDFLVGYATVPGYVSFRSRNHGSWYIRKLCELVEKYSERHDLLSILVKVNEEVSRGNAHVDGGVFKQTPAPVVTLRKKLYFFNQNRRAR